MDHEMNMKNMEKYEFKKASMKKYELKLWIGLWIDVWNDYEMTMKWLWNDYEMTMKWLWNDYEMTMNSSMNFDIKWTMKQPMK